MDKATLVTVYQGIKEILDTTDKHQYTSTHDQDDVMQSYDPTGQAFMILLVAAGHRNAMLIHNNENQGIEQSEQLSQEIQHVMLERYTNLENLFHNNSVEAALWYDSGDVWIYNKSIQELVDEKKATYELFDSIGTPPYSNFWTVSACFEFNGSRIWGMSCKKMSDVKPRQLRRTLEDYKIIAAILGGEVMLKLKYR